MTLKQRADQHDREVAAIRKLILTGMTMINRNQEQINQLTAAQRVTEKKLQAFIDPGWQRAHQPPLNGVLCASMEPRSIERGNKGKLKGCPVDSEQGRQA